MLDNTDFPDILNTDIITDDIDTAWIENEQVKSLDQKNLLIISNPFSTDSEEEKQLQKIIDACQLKTEDHQILQLNEDSDCAWHQIKRATQPHVIILFGTAPRELGVSALFLQNYPNKFDNTIWIPTISLTQLSQQPDVKKQLWGNALKPLFVENK